MPSHPAYVDAVLAHLQRHLDEPLSLDTLATFAGVSRYHLQRSFKQATGHSPAQRSRLLRLKRASLRLRFEPHRSITDLAFEAGYENAESFSRAFRRTLAQSPREFRTAPNWQTWRALYSFPDNPEPRVMQVEIVNFPETRLAAVEHLGSTADVYESAHRLVEWRRAHRVPPGSAATYGVHHDLRLHAASGYRLDIGVAYDLPVAPNPWGVVPKHIPGGRCARVRHQGSREYMPVVQALCSEWLPASGESLRDVPLFFHYVNVGPDVAEHEMITDIYLPLQDAAIPE
jgi:AraC family transcriptional regulator